MVKTLAVVCGLMLAGFAASAQDAPKPKAVYKAAKINEYNVAVSCKNGSDPRITKIDDGVMVITCAKDSK